jgi:hypothetical protein
MQIIGILQTQTFHFNDKSNHTKLQPMNEVGGAVNWIDDPRWRIREIDFLSSGSRLFTNEPNK